MNARIIKTCSIIVLLSVTSISAVFAQTSSVPWQQHVDEVLPDGFDPMSAPVVGVDGPTPVFVQRTTFENQKLVDIYYPSDKPVTRALPAVLLVSGTPDTGNKREYGRPWLRTNQAMGWGRLSAEQGMIAIAYENDGHPVDSLREMGLWLREHASAFGIDVSQIGLWSCSNGCASAMEAFRTGYASFGGIRPSFGVFYYGEVMLKTDMDVTIPIMIVRAANDSQTVGLRIEAFVNDLADLGGKVQFLTHTTGNHAFDVLGDSDETRAILASTFEFMSSAGEVGDGQ